MKTVPLAGKKAAGRVAFVDDVDYELVAGHRWHLVERRWPNGRIEDPYAKTITYPDGRREDVFMHKLITGWPMTDHANGDGLDNRRPNLRPATRALNNHNSRPRLGASSRHKGVTWHRKIGKWQAAIKADGKTYYLGCYDREEDAAAAYAAASLKRQGDYAYAARAAVQIAVADDRDVA